MKLNNRLPEIPKSEQKAFRARALDNQFTYLISLLHRILQTGSDHENSL